MFAATQPGRNPGDSLNRTWLVSFDAVDPIEIRRRRRRSRRHRSQHQNCVAASSGWNASVCRAASSPTRGPLRDPKCSERCDTPQQGFAADGRMGWMLVRSQESCCVDRARAGYQHYKPTGSRRAVPSDRYEATRTGAVQLSCRPAFPAVAIRAVLLVRGCVVRSRGRPC